MEGKWLHYDYGDDSKHIFLINVELPVLQSCMGYKRYDENFFLN